MLETFGIIVVMMSAVQAFWHYIARQFRADNYDVGYQLATGLATGLEFKMAAEILKTVIVHELEELLMLGAVILLRALISLLIHFEMKRNNKYNSLTEETK